MDVEQRLGAEVVRHHDDVGARVGGAGERQPLGQHGLGREAAGVELRQHAPQQPDPGHAGGAERQEAGIGAHGRDVERDGGVGHGGGADDGSGAQQLPARRPVVAAAEVEHHREADLRRDAFAVEHGPLRDRRVADEVLLGPPALVEVVAFPAAGHAPANRPHDESAAHPADAVERLARDAADDVLGRGQVETV